MTGIRTAAARATLLGALLAGPALAQPAANGDLLQIDFATALRLADERNLDVAIYVQRTAEASARLAQARALGIPTLRVGGSYNRHDGNLQETSGNVVEADRAARFSGLGAGAVGAGDLQSPGVALAVDVADAIFQPLVARRNLEAVRAAATANRHAVLMGVAAAYLDLLGARAETRIVLEAAQRARELATLTADYAEAGEGLLADAEMAAVQPILWEQRRLAATERAETAASELVRLLHLDANVTLEPVEDDVPIVEIYGDADTVADLVARALDSRPENDQLDALVAAAESDLDAQRYGWFIPNVTLAYSSGTFGGGPGETIANDGHRDDLTLQLYWQLDAFGVGNRARAEEKRARLRQVGLERDKLRDAIAAEVRSGYARVRSLAWQLELAAPAVDRARGAYGLQRERIYDQQGLPLEALAAMQTLAAAEIAEAELRASYSLAQIRLHTALGNTVDTARR
jgi:outer membrane protein TolC